MTPDTITLGEIAHARSGDKGNHANVGVAAYTAAGFEYLQSQLTPQRMGDFFATLAPTRVERFELPRLWAFNFLLYNALGGGASQSLRIDTQGKLLGTSVLELELPRPANLDAMRRTSQQDATPLFRDNRAIMEPIVKIQVHDHTATVTLNRPEKRNALSRELLQELHQALDDLHQERRVRGVVVAAAGTVFCAGMDLSEMLATTEQEDRLSQWQADSVVYHDLIEAMLRFPKPLIAAVNGPAVAGGAGIVMACDLAVASETAAFGFPEPRRGIVAGMVAPLLAFRVGGGHAAYLLLTAQIIGAREAHRYGLFHELVDEDKVWARANQLVGEVAKSAPEAILATKRLLNETIGESLTSQLAAGAAVSAASRTTEAAAEGLAAFLEKREPKWW